MPNSKNVQIPKTGYSVGICYLAEKVKNGVAEEFHKDLVVLRKNGKIVGKSETKMSITVGRINDLVFEKATKRFVAVSYGAGEFCNGLVVFDVQLKKVAAQRGCFSNSYECHVVEIRDSKCSAELECRDKGTEGELSGRKEPIRQVVSLCN